MNKSNLLGLNQDQLVNLALSCGESAFRGKQLYHQIYQRRQTDLEEMTELSKSLRSRLRENYEVRLPQVRRRSVAVDGTVKYLLALDDERLIETVYIPEERRETLCISSQVGCDVGCTFCLTAQMKMERNLRPAEILGQILVVLADGTLHSPTCNIVFMGMGEPLYNYKNVMAAFRIMTDSAGMAFSQRRVTVSTSGVVPVLKKMQGEPVLPNLAISLNATTDELRNVIMPINLRWGLHELIKACREFPLDPRRRLTFEYVLMRDVNDSDEDAHRLAGLVSGMRTKVNLIPYNPNPGLPYQRPSGERVLRFKELLTQYHLSVFIRKTRGRDISAACGQLAYLEQVSAGV